MVVSVYTLNAFSKDSKGGNPAGVVLDADHLLEAQMKAIAQVVGFSETAFVTSSKMADFKVRFFTPNGEVDLCGHATIATFFLLSTLKRINIGTYTQETKAGILTIESLKNGTLFMHQTMPEFFEHVSKDEVVQSLNIPIEFVDQDLPIQIVSTGLRDLIVPIRSLSDLHFIMPDFDAISRLSKKYNVVGYHVFTMETNFESTAHCRNFAPLLGIPEESATGTASGALSSYLWKHQLATDFTKPMVYEQGYSMNEPSEIFSILKIEDGVVVEVKVGGIASNIEQIKVNI
jgi:PhzF family phenazine biosynthesis protein